MSSCCLRKGYIVFVVGLVVRKFLWYAAHPKLIIGVYLERM